MPCPGLSLVTPGPKRQGHEGVAQDCPPVLDTLLIVLGWGKPALLSEAGRVWEQLLIMMEYVSTYTIWEPLWGNNAVNK